MNDVRQAIIRESFTLSLLTAGHRDHCLTLRPPDAVQSVVLLTALREPLRSRPRHGDRRQMASGDREWSRRVGLSGAAKWSEWDAPDLGLDECLECLEFFSGRMVQVDVQLNGRNVTSMTGVLHAPRAHDRQDGSPPRTLLHLRPLSPAHCREHSWAEIPRDLFRHGSYHSNDDLDYFELTLEFVDRTLTIGDP
jgi:hypothetical protein